MEVVVVLSFIGSRVCFPVGPFSSLQSEGRNVKRIGMGIVGAGLVGPHHIDAVRRLGYVDVVAVAGSTQASAEKKAAALGARKAYGNYEALLNDPDVQVVHNATPNYLHYPVTAAAIAKGKHVVSDKPLAMTAAEAKKLLDQATKAGIVHAVTFNYRGNPLVQQAREAIKRGDIGKPHFLVGQYLQDWLLKDTDYSWRLEPDKGGASSALGDIGSHWCDLAQHISGLRITHVLGDITTVLPTRKKPSGSREAFAAADTNQKFEEVSIKVEDLASVLLRFDNGAKGSFSVGQVCAGHKNDLEIEICGSKASLKWAAGAPERAADRPSRQAQRGPAEGPLAARPRGTTLRAPAGWAPGIVGRCIYECDAGHLRVHRRGAEARRRASARLRHL
jgi:predicted dehydrogenase